MPAPVTVLLNARSGTGAALEAVSEIRAAVPEARIEVLGNPRQIRPKAREAALAGCPVVAAGGGDGTINAVVNGIAGTGAALGVLPMGTLNHFAKDAGIPLGLSEAARVLVEGRAEACDIAEVNGRLFVNNSSLGLYASMVRRRQRVQRRGYGKWMAMALAALTVLRNYSLIGVSLEVDGRRFHRRTPLLFIGNNEYEMDAFNMGSRASLGAGLLSLHVPHDLGPVELFGIGLKALVGRLKGVENMDMLHAREILVQTRRRRLAVAVDGEVEFMRAPLHYRSLPGALRVMRPVR
jgi:diacylglycerol kinase family enzyme